MRHLLLPTLLLLPTIMGKFSRRTKERQEQEEALEELCSQRNPGEFFRVSEGGDCREVATCDREAGTGALRLAPLKCPNGLYFDVERQTCDWLANVDNCDMVALAHRVKPNLYTDSPVCPPGHHQCASGECLPTQAFCDRRPDCSDGSDENACSVTEDPNRAPPCSTATCRLPECFCSADGTRWPDQSMQREEIPMMVTFSFNGAVTEELIEKVYGRLFHEKRENPNGCTARATFFVSHKFTDYSAVEELRRRGHEVGVFSVSHKDDPDYWTEGTYDTWVEEMAGARLILENMANITDGSVLGMRAPFLRAGGNQQFQMMTEQGFGYDASLTAPLARVPVWPYTLHHRLPHACIGTARCPSRQFPVWQLPINELDRRESGSKSSDTLTGCHHVSSCTHLYHPHQLKQLLNVNLKRHMTTNRAPLSLSFNPAWLISQEGFVEAVDEWMTEVARKHSDVYFVTHQQVIQYLEHPVTSRSIRDLPEGWKERCGWSRRRVCLHPTTCLLTSPELPGEEVRLRTCQPCPHTYPWLANPTGEKPTWGQGTRPGTRAPPSRQPPTRPAATEPPPARPSTTRPPRSRPPTTPQPTTQPPQTRPSTQGSTTRPTTPPPPTAPIQDLAEETVNLGTPPPGAPSSPQVTPNSPQVTPSTPTGAPSAPPPPGPRARPPGPPRRAVVRRRRPTPASVALG